MEKRMNLLRGKAGGTDLQCIGAFVVFNNEESAIRCVEDYKCVGAVDEDKHCRLLPMRRCDGMTNQECNLL